MNDVRTPGPVAGAMLPTLPQMQTSAIALLLSPVLGSLFHRYTGLSLSNEESGLLAAGLLGFLHWAAIRLDRCFPAPAQAAGPPMVPPAT